MDISVVKAMQVIRDAAMVAQRAEVAPLVAAAVEVANAYEESLSQQAIVSISAGPALSADEIARKVVEQFDIIAAERVAVALPDGVPPVPWRVDGDGDVWSASDRIFLSGLDLDAPVYEEGAASAFATVHAIVEAVNAYFGVRQPPSPAEAATANCETHLPDTAGYPVPDYDAVEIPEAGEAPGETLCPVKFFVDAVETALLRIETDSQASKVFQHAIAAAVSLAGVADDISEAEATTAWRSSLDAVRGAVDSVVAARPGPQRLVA